MNYYELLRIKKERHKNKNFLIIDGEKYTYENLLSYSEANPLVKNTNSVRIEGTDRFETNKNVIDYFFNSADGFYVSDGYQ
ncbi:hypothetical protein ACTPEF_25400, partial [Clostridioides difficile]